VVLHSQDAGESWQLQRADPEADAPLLGLWCAQAPRVLAVGAFGTLLETRDGGRSWQARTLAEGSDFHLNEIFPADGALYVAAEAGHVYRSRDAGATWQECGPDYSGSFWGGLATREGVVFVFGMRGHLFRSDDQGASWRELSSGTDQSLAAGIQLGDGRIVLAGIGGVIASSSDGLHFASRVREGRKSAAALVEAAPGVILVFGEAGVERLQAGDLP
jgi:photosystem II stability/assembly factor-like uncharacterized protein